MRLPEMEHRKLSNGTELTALVTGNQPIVQLTMVWDGGTHDFANPALPELVASTLRDGCSTLSGDEIEYILDFNGAWLKSSVKEHNATITLTSLSSKLRDVLPAIKGILESPSFPEQRINRHKDQMAATWELQRKKVSFLAEQASIKQLAGKGHPITANATPELIRSVEIDEMAQWQKRMYATGSMSAYLAGSVTPDEMRLVIDFLESLNSDSQPIVTGITPFKPDYDTPEIIVDHKGALQSAVTMSMPTIDRSHPDYSMLRLAIKALGGYFGSRLMTNLREKQGLTYGVSAALYGYREGGAIVVSTQCDNRNVKAVIEGTKHEIRELIANPPSGEELERLTQTASTELAANLDSPFNIINLITLRRTAGIPDNYFDCQQSAIAALSSETIADCASRYLDVNKMFVAIAGDTESIVK